MTTCRFLIVVLSLFALANCSYFSDKKEEKPVDARGCPSALIVKNLNEQEQNGWKAQIKLLEGNCALDPKGIDIELKVNIIFTPLSGSDSSVDQSFSYFIATINEKNITNKQIFDVHTKNGAATAGLIKDEVTIRLPIPLGQSTEGQQILVGFQPLPPAPEPVPPPVIEQPAPAAEPAPEEKPPEAKPELPKPKKKVLKKPVKKPAPAPKPAPASVAPLEKPKLIP
ncbi:MAG: hypothetical protein AB7G80_00835 [Dongiaceae bacterium]